jgi:hypothetical protein
MIGQISPEVFKAIGEQSIPRTRDRDLALTCLCPRRLECVQEMTRGLLAIRPIDVLTDYAPILA